MNKKQIIGAVVAAALFIIIGISSVLTHVTSSRMLADTAADEMQQILSGGMTLSLPRTSYVGVVTVNGVIEEQLNTTIFDVPQTYQHDATMEYIDEMMYDTNNKGILLDVDSPGGAVYEGQELYDKLMEYKETTGRPIWTYMNHYAASGGYYVAMASDRIYANQNTTTGSIGVIMSGYDLTGLYEKLGIKSVSITSGENKDMSKLTEEQIAIYQAMVDEAFETFVDIVAKGRNMDVETVRKLADGRTYTAKQALENGLIDEISSYQDALNAIQHEAGYAEFYQPNHGTSVMSSFFAKISEVVPKSETQILNELTEEFGSGVPLYYAEQLQ